MDQIDSKKFFQHSASSLDWGDLSEKTVMDIGCGEGGNSTLRLVELFPNVREVVAIDRDPSLIEVAEFENRHPKVEYHVADIEVWPTLVHWKGQIHVVASHYCFNCVTDRRKAFENVYQLLVPGGTAAIFFVLSANFYDWGKKMGEMYSQYKDDVILEPHESHVQNYGASHYEDDLKALGFTIVECDDEFHSREFRTDLECKSYLRSVCPISGKIPRGEMKTFTEKAFSEFLKYSPRNDEGFTSVKYRTAKILLRKPIENE